jgi:hypothetical protein
MTIGFFSALLVAAAMGGVLLILRRRFIASVPQRWDWFANVLVRNFQAIVL